MLQTITDQMYDEKQFKFFLDDEIAVQFLLGALNQCGRWWIARSNKISREEMQKSLYKIVDAYMKAINYYYQPSTNLQIENELRNISIS